MVTEFNRNGYEVYFEEVPQGYNVSCPRSGFCRMGSPTEASKQGLAYYDFDGGPFIAVGDNLKTHHSPNLPDKVIKRIEPSEDGVLLITE